MSIPYWGDFTDKYGFGDGGDVPSDAEMVWRQNVLVINRCAKKTGSKVRVVRWLRPGAHNPFLICTVSVEFYNALPEEIESAEGVLNWHIEADFGNEAEWDDAFAAAIEMASDILYENTCVIVSPEWDGDALEKIFELIDESEVSEYLNSETGVEDE